MGEAFPYRRFILRHRPRYWLHGHTHLLDQRLPRLTTIGATTVINVYGHYELDTAAPVETPTIVARASDLLRSS